jgi:glutamate 5-kinase
MTTRKQFLGRAKRIVVKLGTGLLTDRQNRLAPGQVEHLVAQLAGLNLAKRELVLVSSGAIGAGMAVMGRTKRPKLLPDLQAAAAIGQCKLMAVYDEIFGTFNLNVAQVLLTHDDLRNRTRHLNARNTIDAILHQGVVPIINENDTVSVDEIKFGDNDTLSALTATLIDADLLIILSHVEGLLKEGAVIPQVDAVTPDIEQLAGGTDRVTSVGGMKSKISAAKICARAGIPMVIANGDRPNVLAELLDGQEIGTLFVPRPERLPGRKRWIAFFQRPAACLTVDDGAKQALCADGRSLLAKGVTKVEGAFQPDDVISIRDLKGTEFARGLAKVDHTACVGAQGVIVHRDDLVIL